MQKEKRIIDEKYLGWIRTLPCVVCLVQNPHMDTSNSTSEPHHVNKVGHGTMGGKTDDSRAIPICHDHHNEYHDKGRISFCSRYDLDLEYTITELNRIYDEIPSKNAK